MMVTCKVPVPFYPAIMSPGPNRRKLPWRMAPDFDDGTHHVVSRLTLSPVGSLSDVQARRRARRLWNLSILGVMETSDRYR